MSTETQHEEVKLEGVVAYLHRSTIDGSLVVQIDSDNYNGPLRVYLNDGALWNGDPEFHHHDDCECVTRWEEDSKILVQDLTN